MVSVHDLWRIYIKPSLGNKVITRTRTVKRESEKVIAINQLLVAAPVKPATLAKMACQRLNMTEGGTCRIESFRVLLRHAIVFVEWKMVQGKENAYPSGFVNAIRNRFNQIPEDVRRIFEEIWTSAGGGGGVTVSR